VDCIKKKTKPYHLLLTSNIPYWQRQTQIYVKEWKKVFQVNGTQKQAEVIVLISDKADFKTKITSY
jgi:hypothetical protein